MEHIKIKLSEENEHMEIGSHQAAQSVQKALRHAFCGENNVLHFCEKDVNVQEFTDMVRALVAFAMEHTDEKISLYYCKHDCARFCDTPCEHEHTIHHLGTSLCPYYVEK